MTDVLVQHEIDRLLDDIDGELTTHSRVVDALLTNFHMPKSSLLVMLAAFCGPGWRDLYAAALSEGYRFLSFGDAMFVQRSLSGSTAQEV